MAKRKKSKYLISPEGVRMKVTNENAFARKHNLDQGNLHKTLMGERVKIKGWTSTHPRVRHRVRKWTLINVETKEIAKVYFNVSEFARERKLNKVQLFRVAKGLQLMYKNWMNKEAYDMLYNVT